MLFKSMWTISLGENQDMLAGIAISLVVLDSLVVLRIRLACRGIQGAVRLGCRPVHMCFCWPRWWRLHTLLRAFHMASGVGRVMLVGKLLLERVLPCTYAFSNMLALLDSIVMPSTANIRWELVLSAGRLSTEDQHHHCCYSYTLFQLLGIRCFAAALHCLPSRHS